ncbi:hypothetical protein ACFV1C_16085 [Streptomyces sp. NPDC059605]|uniref:hypothetical protein n=1 Tax=unclassified Streptomyces TaxID=2593676 RepID=UPI0036B27B7E
MREGSRNCVMCTAGLLGGTAYLVDGARRQGRRSRALRFLICEACYERGCPDPETGLTREVSARRTKRAEWWSLAGRGEALPPQECVAGCGLVVVRGAETLMKGVTCSRACRTSLTRKRNGGQGSGRPCGACGKPVTAGRADSAYCGGRCRQKAYRRRAAARTADPVPELLAAAAPFATAAPAGISQVLYKALYRLHAAHLRGHGLEEPVAKLESMNPDRIMIPDTADGRRLRAALHGLRTD